MKTKSLAAAFTTDWRFLNGINNRKDKNAGVDVFINWVDVTGGSASQNCNITSGSIAVEVPDTSLVSVGNYVDGVGITVGSQIVTITDATHIVISIAATATTTGVTLVFEELDGGLQIELLHEDGDNEIITRKELYTDSDETEVYKIDSRSSVSLLDPLHLAIDVPLTAYRLVYTPNGVVSGILTYTETFK